MPSFRIFELPISDDTARAEGANVLAVQDGFRWSVFYFPLPWLLLKRLWLPALACIVAYLVSLGFSLRFDFLPAVVVTTAANFFIALEGTAFEAARLVRRGWRERAVLIADDEELAVLRYLEARVDPAHPAANQSPTLPDKAPVQKPKRIFKTPKTAASVIGQVPNEGGY